METKTLLVDLGNSSLKWGWLEGQGVSGSKAVLYRKQSLLALLDGQWSELPKPHKLAVAAVAPIPMCRDLEQWVRSHWNIQPLFLKASRMSVGVNCGYVPVSQLGIDRWAAIVAAYATVQSAVCIVDCGTAITIDVVDGQGAHLGGFILPGIEMTRHCLLNNSGIEMIEGSDAPGFWGIDTNSAVGLGTLKAASGLITQTMDELRTVAAAEPGLIYTGGDAPAVFKLIEPAGEYRRDLVLEGVALLAREQK